MPRRRPVDEDFDSFEDDNSDPIATLIERVLDVPQVRDTLVQMQYVLDQAGYAIDRVARKPVPMRPRPEAPPRPRQAPPPPPRRPAPPPKDDPRVVLGFPAGLKLTRQMVKQRQRALAAIYHPDKQGSDEAMKRLNVAAAELLAGLK